MVILVWLPTALVEVEEFPVSLVLASCCKNIVELEEVVESRILRMPSLDEQVLMAAEGREEKQQEKSGYDLNMKMGEVEGLWLYVLLIQTNCSMEVVILEELFVWSLDVIDTSPLIWLMLPHKVLSTTTQTLVSEVVMLSNHSLPAGWWDTVVSVGALIVASLWEYNDFYSACREKAGHAEGV